MTPEERKNLRVKRGEEQREIEAAIPGLKWAGYGNGLPWQGEGTLGGKPFYARFRHNQASLTIYDKPPNFDGKDNSRELMSSVVWPYFPEDSEEACGGHAGTLHGPDDIIPFMQRVIAELKPTSDDNPSSMMILAQQVKALTKAMREGKLKIVVRDMDGNVIE